LTSLCVAAAPSAPGVVELKAEKQRADQQAGIKPKPDSKTKSTDEEAKDTATGFQGWMSRNKPVVALALIACVALCVQASGVADVKGYLLTLLSPITTALWKVKLCSASDCATSWNTPKSYSAT